MAIAHLFDLRPNDNYFARLRFAGKKRDATGGRERDRATNARREPGSVDANCRERSVFPRSNRARRAPAFAFASFRERGGGANARSSRDGDPGKGPDRAGSDRRYRAVVGSDRRRFGPGARFLAFGIELGCVGYAANCARYRGSIECHSLRSFHRGANADRFQLLFKKSRGNVGGNGNAGGGADCEMLFRPGRAGHPAAGPDDHANPGVNALAGMR